MSKRDAEQGAGVESGLSQKQKIGNYSPRGQHEKSGKPKSPATEQAPRGHKIK